MKKSTIITVLCVTACPMLLGLGLWNQLPAEMPVHFDWNGVANSFASKPVVVFGLPLFMSAVLGICIFFTMKDPKHENISNKTLGLVLWTVPIISILVNGGIYAIALGHTINVVMWTQLFIGILFILLGNYLPKTKQNYTVGIKLPWTLHSRENWNRTHRFGGYIFILAGFAMIASYFFTMPVVFVAAIIVPVVAVMIYSYMLYRKGI